MKAQLKVALIGYGKMGKILEPKAKDMGYEVIAIISSKLDHKNETTFNSIKNADILIDFSHPDAVVDNVKLAAAFSKNIVVGTTGWQKDYLKVEALVKESGIGFLYSPNFSIGVALFLQLIEKANAIIRPFKQYDVAGIETHHNKKIDAPSGTAKAIEEKMNAQLKEGMAPLEFSSVRVGSVPGIHTLVFDSPEDTITLTHTARNREGFASGALIAANWLQGKKGIYTLNDMLQEKGFSTERTD